MSNDGIDIDSIQEFMQDVFNSAKKVNAKLFASDEEEDTEVFANDTESPFVNDAGPLLMPIGQGMRGMTQTEQDEYYKDYVTPEKEEYIEPKFRLGRGIMNQKTYRKIPVEVQGLKWTGTNIHEMHEFVGKRDNGEWKFLTPAEISGVMESSAIVWDDVQGGWIPVNMKDTILCGVNGEFYPISEDVLAKTYEEVR